MIKEAACLLIFLSHALSAMDEQWTVTSRGLDVPFRSWEVDGARAGTEVLVLVFLTNQLPPTKS